MAIVTGTVKEDIYEDIHRTWDTVHTAGSPIYNFRQRLLWRRVPKDLRGKRVLEFGCGTGKDVFELLRRGATVVGVDLSAYAIENLEQRIPAEYRRQFTGVVADIFKWEPEEQFDLCIVSEVLEHVKDDDIALATIGRHLKPGGYVIITVPADPALWSKDDEYSLHERRYEPGRLERISKEAGLEARVVECYGYFFFRAYAKLKARIPARPEWKGQRAVYKKGWRQLALHAFNAFMGGLSRFDQLFLHRNHGLGWVVVAYKPETAK